MDLQFDHSPRRWKSGFPGVTKRFEWFAINYTGRFWVENPGIYKFNLLSDDGSQLYVDEGLVVDNDCQHSPLSRESSVELAGGIHHIRVAYFQGPRDCLALKLAVAGPDEKWRVFSTDEFKPPSNTGDWRFGGQGELEHSQNPNGLKMKPAKAQTRGEARLAVGCRVPDPVPQCHG